MDMSTVEGQLADTDDMELVTPGTLLRQTREQQQLTPEAVADELRMALTLINALENDQYEKLSSDVFVRGYLRSYAKLLKLDGADLVKRYNNYRGTLSETSSVFTANTEIDPIPLDKPKSRTPLYLFLLFIVGCWIAAYFLWLREPTLGTTNIVPAQVETTDNSSTLSSDAMTASGTEADTQIQLPGAVTEPANSANASFSSIDNQQNTDRPVDNFQEINPELDAGGVAAASAQVLDQLLLNFSDECWVEVSDAKGDVLYTNLRQAGETLLLEGVAPFNVMLGNAREVELLLNGEQVMFDAGDRKTLRFMVGEDT